MYRWSRGLRSYDTNMSSEWAGSTTFGRFGDIVPLLESWGHMRKFVQLTTAVFNDGTGAHRQINRPATKRPVHHGSHFPSREMIPEGKAKSKTTGSKAKAACRLSAPDTALGRAIQ
jgi:hypothetical protein